MFGRKGICLVLLALAALTVCAGAQDKAPLRCSVKGLKGSWGFTCSGMAANPLTITPTHPTPLIQPFAMNGTFTSDGNGQIWGPGWANFNGTVMEQFATTVPEQPLVVNPDCTGSTHYVLTAGPGGQQIGEMDFKTVQLSENEMLGLPSSPGMIVICHVIRIQAR